MASHTRFVLVVGSGADAMPDEPDVQVLARRENVALLEVPWDRVGGMLEAFPGAVHVFGTREDADRAYALFEPDR
jgi:hypothetical protein